MSDNHDSEQVLNGGSGAVENGDLNDSQSRDDDATGSANSGEVSVGLKPVNQVLENFQTFLLILWCLFWLVNYFSNLLVSIFCSRQILDFDTNISIVG